MKTASTTGPHLTRYAWLSIAAAILTIGMKTAAYFLTGSVGLLSDALESVVNLAGALMALAMLTIAARPADEEHAYGHSKAEYFSSGFEGALILVAAVMIAVTAIRRLIAPEPLEQVGLGSSRLNRCLTDQPGGCPGDCCPPQSVTIPSHWKLTPAIY